MASSSSNVTDVAESARTHDCKLCGGRTAAFMVRNRFDILRCQSCAFMFAVLPAGLDLDRIYQDDSYWAEGGDLHYLDGYDDYWRGVREFYEARLPRIRRLTKGTRMLEVGCADGRFLAMARARGFEVSGIELSDTMRAECRRRLGIETFKSVPEALATGTRYDCVVMFEVIEHVADPIAFLKQVRELLRPGGVVALSTPNFGCDEAVSKPQEFEHFAPPAHVSYFVPETLSACIAKAGFRTVETVPCFAGQELPIPEYIAAVLRPLRKGKRRLRPGGLIGKLIKNHLKRRMLKLPDADKDMRLAHGFELYAEAV